ncbi:MAG: restriction endonuclease [Burkholderiaceae bacterium]
MNFKPRPNSIFATLARKPWWISALIAVGIAAFALLALPPVIAPAGVCAAVPFVVIAGISAWKRRKLPSEAAIESTVAAVTRMSWVTFADVLTAAFVRDGSAVEPIADKRADLVLTRSGRVAVVSARRWKVARTGVEPLKELLAVRQARDAHESIYVTVGEISDPARAFARQHDIQFMAGSELARLMPELRRTPVSPT